MFSEEEKISLRRESVLQSYIAAKAANRVLFSEGNYKVSEEYIFPNQIEDANAIVNLFYREKCRVVSVQKKTKVGADGLMIEIAKLLSTHIDDNFITNFNNVRFITGMSNVGWEKDMIDKVPLCFKNKIFHHGKLSKSDIKNIKNCLIILDEVDAGSKEKQCLHNVLIESGVLDIKRMEEDNNKFVFISATMNKELYDLYRWGDLHKIHKMTIPPSYIGHNDFLQKGIVKEFYCLNTIQKAEKWVKEDIIDNYKTDYRVHFIRVNEKNINCIRDACVRNNIGFRNHTSSDRLSEEDQNELFINPIEQHKVVFVKGLFRRANLIPNSWKLRVGAVHEFWTKKVDNNVQIQGLVGRMTGYWRDIIEKGHKTGPYRTSKKAIEEYEKIYLDPFGENSYTSSGFKKNKGKLSVKHQTMLSVENIKNLDAVDLPNVYKKGSHPIIIFPITEEEKLFFSNTEEILRVFEKHHKVAYEKYKFYKPHCWRIDTPQKCEKYCLNAMSKKNAYSSETNIRDTTENVLMIYLHDNNLIINAWSGSSTFFSSDDECKYDNEGRYLPPPVNGRTTI